MTGSDHTTQRIPVHTLLQSALADGWHETGVALRQRRLIVDAPRAVRINRLVNRPIELQQVFEYFTRAQILAPMRPSIIVNDLFALIDECSAHIE